MGTLVPTPIIDSLGRATTVHRRPVEPARSRNASALASAAVAAPASTPRQKASGPVKVKLKEPRRWSREVALAARMDLEGAGGDSRVLASRAQRLTGQTVEVGQDDAYAFLRLGIDLQGAALLTALGASPEATARTLEIARIPEVEDETFARRRGVDTKTSTVTDAMQEAGIPVAKAEKALIGGLQDAQYCASTLEIDQLVALFSRWKYSSRAYPDGCRGGSRKDEVIDSIVLGRLPFDMLDRPVQQLTGVSSELHRTERSSEPHSADLRRAMREDPALVHDICRRLAGDTYEREYGVSGVLMLHRIVQDHGREALGLRIPMLALLCGGVEGARYVERIAELAKERSRDSNWIVGMRAQSVEQGVRLFNEDALRMREAGLSPEEAYDAVAVQRLTPSRAIAVHESGVRGALTDGVL